MKVLYVSSMPAPHQIKLAAAINNKIKCKFLFYDELNVNRPTWWNIPLNEYCSIVTDVIFKYRQKYILKVIPQEILEYKPDLIVLGGFSIPANYQIYRWAIKRNIKVAVFTEMSRDKKGRVRKYGFNWKFIRYLYSKVNSVYCCNSDAYKQFKEDFKFRNKCVKLRYASDIDEYLKHDVRIKEVNEKIKLFFPNRLIDIYNPLCLLESYAEMEKNYNIELLMNGQGELRNKCEQFIKSKNIKNASFIDDVKSWNSLNKVYKNSDILVFPAKYSNGNFTINECMASGMGLVVSNKVKGHSKDLTNDINCFITEPEVEEVIANVEKYLKNPKLIKKHGEINKSKSVYLSIKNTADEYINEFNRTCGI